jgi:CheY-like chemotaxis protein
MELATDVRRSWPESEVKIVAVTTDVFDHSWKQWLISGFDGWLAKPFRLEDLVKVMQAVT